MYYDCFTPDGFVVDADGFWIKYFIHSIINEEILNIDKEIQ